MGMYLNLAIAFVLEVVAWVAVSVAASRLVDGTAARLLVGLAAFAVVTTVWGLLAAPKARVQSDLVRIATKVVVFAGAAVALADLISAAIGIAFAVAAAVNVALLSRRSE
ncbi:MAG TPA: DUF2568 domain-containing protein [Nocardioidaceae bacterium]|nr:DUF2568 domain-containing protein [Nocardioidaceae bacterium]